MKGTVVKIARFLLFLGVGIFFLYMAFRGIPLENLATELKAARPGWVALSLFFALLAFISRALRWVILIEPLGSRPSAVNTFHALMTGYFANFILPRIGEVTRCGSLNRTDRIPVDSLLGTVITERIIDLLVLVLLATAIFLARIELFGDFILAHIVIPAVSRISSLADLHPGIYLLALATVAAAVFSFHYLAMHFRKKGITGKITKIAGKVITGMKTIIRLERKAMFLFHTLFIWLMYILMTWAVFKALPATSGLGPADALFVMVIGGLGMAAPVQGGFGTYHWIVTVGLTLYGIPRNEGLAFALLSHESQALLMILLGSVSMFVVFARWRRKSRTIEQK